MTDGRPDPGDWWRTSIIDTEPGRIVIRGRPVEELIGTWTFAQVIWLMTTGEELAAPRARLLEAALVAAVDHGPHAPSIAAARMAITCGVGINNALASGVNMLGDVHGGAGEQALELFTEISEAMEGGRSAEAAVADGLSRWRRERTAYVPGYGHRFHKSLDPRAPPLLGLVDEAVEAGDITGLHAKIARSIEKALADEKGRPVPLNIDGATAVIFGELGCPPALARGLFCLSRSVGIVAHAWEQSVQGGRNKGPIPPEYGLTYDGP